MTLEKAIKLAKEQGYNIKYTKRKDGGVRITEINGKSYKNSEGNKAFRKQTHSAGLSAKRVRQLKTGQKIAKDTQKFKRLNKIRKKLGKKEISKEDYRKARKQGKGKQMRERMLYSIRKKLGFAGASNVTTFIERLEEAGERAVIYGDGYSFDEVIKWLKENGKYVTEEALTTCILILYDFMNGLIDGQMAEGQMLVELKIGQKELSDLDIDFEKLRNGTGW